MYQPVAALSKVDSTRDAAPMPSYRGQPCGAAQSISKPVTIGPADARPVSGNHGILKLEWIFLNQPSAKELTWRL